MKFNSKEGINFIRDRKTAIETRITKKIDELMPSGKLIAKRCILTGGAISSIFNSEEPNDYDLLFLFSTDLESVRANYGPILGLDNIMDFDPDYDPDLVRATAGKRVSKWAITMKNGLQFVLRTVEYRNQFDFVHCMPYYDITRKKLYISHEQFDCIMKKVLVVNPNCATDKPLDKRINKYINRGWTNKTDIEEIKM